MITNYMFKMGRDFNGNKIVKVICAPQRGFSIQTNGNLPNTHRANDPDGAEIVAWIRKYGTHRQKELFT